jgi:hypothetical protein
MFVPDRGAARVAPLTVGFDDSLFSSSDEAVRDRWLSVAKKDGAGIIRLGATWSSISPSPPPSAAAAAAAGWSGYNWNRLDGAVRSASARGLQIFIKASRAPRWAEGADRPSSARPGTWKPDPVAYGAFGKALASRYSGRFPDPEVPGAALQPVRFFEAWNEPNQDYYLAPQWRGRRLFGAGWYRDMLNHFYAGVKAGQRQAKVIAPATSPYGDRPGGGRVPPVAFLRSLFCMRVGELKNYGCPVRPRFDILSHHPINLGEGPNDHALNPMDASTPDVERLVQVLRRAEERRLVLPRLRRPVWATEIWWNTNPPLVYGVPPWKQARWVVLSQYVMWKQGVRVMINLPMVDPPFDPRKDQLHSGVFTADGSRKPSYTAFRFPLVMRRVNEKEVVAWGKAPKRGPVRIQRRRGAGWITVGRLRARPTWPFELRLAQRGPATFRAIGPWGSSLPWRQG